jgi:hypothetical protein
MKKCYAPILLILTILVSACSSEDNLTESNDQSLLKSYKLTKDVNGRYTIDVGLIDGAYSETFKDETTNTNNIYTYQGSNTNRKSFNTQELTLDNNRIEIDVFENDIQKNTIWVEDENIKIGKGQISPNYLQAYSLEYLGEGEYVLDFEVRDGVAVSFEYNADENIYEVHLKEGVSNGKKFTKLYDKAPSLPLRIDFVNYMLVRSKGDGQAKSAEAYVVAKMPRILNEGND